MPQEPKKRHSRARQGKRRAAIKLSVSKSVNCSNCGKITLPHMVCKNCGFYKGKEVINKAKKEKKLSEAESDSAKAKSASLVSPSEAGRAGGKIQ